VPLEETKLGCALLSPYKNGISSIKTSFVVQENIVSKVKMIMNFFKLQCF